MDGVTEGHPVRSSRAGRELEPLSLYLLNKSDRAMGVRLHQGPDGLHGHLTGFRAGSPAPSGSLRRFAFIMCTLKTPTIS